MLQETISEDMKSALKTGKKLRLSVLRNIKSEISNQLVTNGEKPDGQLPDKDVVEVIARLAKQRREAASEFDAGERAEMADKERAELEILEEYLPEAMGDDELETLVESVIAEVGAEDMSGMGQVMGKVMAETGPATDGDTVRKLVEEKLSSSTC
ncbi:MAG: GatB/YqeY domain-containing protein [Candidatus Paceibacterota bacterium]